VMPVESTVENDEDTEIEDMDDPQRKAEQI
jgi:hypothetical protein